MPSLPVVSTGTVERLVGPAAYGRGLRYALDDRVSDLAWDSAGGHLTALVRGSTFPPYSVDVTLGAADGGSPRPILDSWCSCPVGSDCKHAAAALLAANFATDDDVEAPAPEPLPAWRTQLAPLIRATQPVVSQPPRLALQLTILPPLRFQWHSIKTARVGARPMMIGKKGSWIQGSVGWSNVSHVNDVRSVHTGLLRSLFALYGADATVGYAPQWIELNAISSPLLWRLLADMDDAGLAVILDNDEQTPATILREAATIELDVRRTSDGLVARPGVWLADQQLPAGRFAFVGQPPHGVAIWELDAAGVVPLAITLARLDPGVDAGSPGAAAALTSLALAGQAVTVPADDEAVFAAEVLTPLIAAGHVGSHDATFHVPALPEPTLEATVQHGSGGVIDIAFGWRYATSDQQVAEGVRRELWAGPGEPGYRDPAREAELLNRVTWLVDACPTLIEHTAHGRRIAGHASFRGDAVVAFARDVLPRLRESDDVRVVDVGVVLDYAEALKDPTIRITTTPRAGSSDWFDLDVEVEIDGEDVAFADLFLALANDDQFFVLPSGTYLTLDRPQLFALRGLIEEARSLTDREGSGLRVNRFHVDLWRELQELGVVDTQAAQWREAVHALVEQPPAREMPAAVHATLRAYQQSGFEWLAFLREHGLGGILADDMGLGKTLQAITVMADGRVADDPPFLVIAPTSVMANWASECGRFAPSLEVAVVGETSAKRGTSLAEAIGSADVVVTSYTLFRLDFDAIDELPWAGLFLDEAQFVKNHQSIAHGCARRLKAPVKVAMTGTPMENNLMELWSLLSITAPGLFPSPKRFADYYQRPIEREGDDDRLALLRRRISPFLLRRTKEEVAADLPPKQEQVLEVELLPAHRKVYDTYLQRERQKVLGLLADLDANRFEIFRSLTMLRQLALDASLVDEEYARIPSTKLDVLLELLEDVVAEGHRTLVFSQFTSYLSRARARLDAAGIRYSYLDGSTRKRAEVIEGFRSGTDPVFLISLKAGGFGLNLTEADYVILLDPWWNPATEAQAVDRVHRIGQDKHVMVYRFVARDTIEEKVMALKASKAALFDAVVTGSSTRSAGLTSAEIRELLA